VSPCLYGKLRVFFGLQTLRGLFCTSKKVNSFAIKQIQALFAKHPGWVSQRSNTLEDQTFVSFAISSLSTLSVDESEVSSSFSMACTFLHVDRGWYPQPTSQISALTWQSGELCEVG
jgi:hypothetical protein